MAENLLSDARVRSAAHAKDGTYLPDGGGLRIRLLPPSRNHAKGARLAEYHFKLKGADGAYKNGALHLGTIGDPFTDANGKTRPFGLADARQARDAARELVSRGVDPRQAARLADAELVEAQRRRLAEIDSRQTVRQAVTRWRAVYLALHHKDGGQYAEDIFARHVFPSIGGMTLADVQGTHVAEMLDALTSAGKRRTAGMVLQLVRQFMRWAVKRNLIDREVTASLTKSDAGGKPKPRARALSPLEVVELRDKLPLSALADRIQHALWLILATGCRVGELSAARVADFDMASKVWTIPATKNGSAHVVHLSAFAVEHAKRLIELRRTSTFMLPSRHVSLDDDDPVAERDDKPISHAVIGKMVNDRQRTEPLKGRTKASWALLLARGKWTPHDLRRTMATRMRQDLRVSSDVVERCLNHKPQGIVAVYQTGELMAERKEAFEAWGAELERLMKLDATNIVELGARAAGKAAA